MPFELKPNQELRFQVGEEPIRLELRRGLAEVYGTELLLNKTYTFRSTTASVYSYQGATIEVTGNLLKCHVGQKCDYMTRYLSIHGDLEKMREEDTTPICLVCKPIYARNVGKSALCKILLNYATRQERVPIFVDIDPDQGMIGLPGTIGAVSIESPIDIETGLSLKSSMLMHYGHIKPCENGLLYRKVVENMATIVHSKLEQDKKSKSSGVIINTSAWSEEADYKILVHACKAFKANMVLVMDDEVLQDDLKNDLDSSVTVLNVPKTVGIARVSDTEIGSRYIRISDYFYGNYQPMTSEIKFSVLKRLIYKLGNPFMLPDSLMPLGGKPQDMGIKVSQLDCTASDLYHRVLAISYCKIKDVLEDPELVLRTNVMGFICITNVRADGEVVTVLTPQKFPIDHVLLYSEVQYMDSI